MRDLPKDDRERYGTDDRTVLITDVVESTQRIEMFGIDRWFALIQAHRRAVSAVTEAHRGSIGGFTGDGFLSVFASAADGVHAGLRLQQALRLEHEVDFRIGVASGPVVIDRSLSVVGLCVHKAARLCAISEPGGVLIDETTYAAAGTNVSPLPEREVLRLRGFLEPTAVRRARARVEEMASGHS